MRYTFFCQSKVIVQPFRLTLKVQPTTTIVLKSYLCVETAQNMPK
ncbi:hypothetical protein HMPREF9151_00579 [Hoylesella saccharolytica F0055]|uniref:Uncharacterized protein n=1 Tax=Hoylesella saccharolytica F0055 TaxID=1127699 RepID=L1NIA0_9BACT|nr:hypothetical protein HMPREF9151_00579 [Hoylesella saccharolytica F0055]